MDDLQIGLLVLLEVEAFGEDEDGVDLSLGIKVWDTLFYLPRESDAGASWVFSVTTLEIRGGGLVVSLESSFTSARHDLGLGMVYGAQHVLGD